MKALAVVRTLAEAHRAALEAVQHAEVPRVLVPGAPAAASASCARCGGPVPTGRQGRPRPTTRYCSPACRLADVRDRRAEARGELLAALRQLGEVASRIEAALRILGLNPTHPRPRGTRLRHPEKAPTP